MKTNQVRNVGNLKTVHTWEGTKVFRQEKIFIPELNYDMPCAPYDNHFIFENPDKKKGSPSFMCTCGSPAVFGGYDAYMRDGSMQGAMWLCMTHSMMNKHLDGSS